LSAKFGPEISLRDLTDRFSYGCLWRAEARSKRGKSACGVYLPDLEHPAVVRGAAGDGEVAAGEESLRLSIWEYACLVTFWVTEGRRNRWERVAALSAAARVGSGVR
jgi:hypothetical protein